MRLIDGDALFDLEKARHDFFDGVTYIGDKARRDEITNFMADIKNSPTVSGWVSVKDRLPENEKIVIGYTPCDGYMFIGFYRTYKFATYEWSDWNIITSMRSTKKITKKVTHWMPLPPGPEDDK